MKWRKLGKIFDPDTHGLPAGCVGWAQSPQPLVLEDRVRIYFSTRMLDPVAEGKYLSHVAYVDMTKDLETVLGVADEPVIDLGALGTFDEHGIFPMNVVRRGRRALRLHDRMEPPRLGLGRDGHRAGREPRRRPELRAGRRRSGALGHDARAVPGRRRARRGGSATAFTCGTSSARTGSATPRTASPTARTGSATPNRADGIHWTKEDEGRRIVADVLGEEECQALPSVVEIDGRHHMVFCFRHSYDFRTNPERGYRIGHAWSDDLRTWTRDDATLTVQRHGWRLGLGHALLPERVRV